MQNGEMCSVHVIPARAGAVENELHQEFVIPAKEVVKK